jgi:NitT/TauT family transport system permease protein
MKLKNDLIQVFFITFVQSLVLGRKKGGHKMEVAVKKVVEESRNGEVILQFLRKLANFFWHGISIWVFIALWELAPRVGWVPQTFIAPPTVVMSTLWDLLLSGVLIKHVEASLFRSLWGFTIAAIVGIPFGFFLGGWFKLFERIISPVLNLLHAVNPFSRSLYYYSVLAKYLKWR